MAVTQYIGSRYVPIFADPVEWTKDATYEPLTIVTYQGNSYTSKQYVPKGKEITDPDYWVVTGNYNAQVEAYRVETREAVKHVDEVGEQAQNNADAAKDSADAALASANGASKSAAAAKTSETNAAVSAAEAEKFKTNAGNYANECNASASTAEKAAQDASTSKRDAELSAEHALSHEQAAAESASSAKKNADNAIASAESIDAFKIIDSGVRRQASLNTYERHTTAAPCFSDDAVTFNEKFDTAPNVVASINLNITLNSSTEKPSELEAKSSMAIYVHDVTTTGFKVRVFNTGENTSPEALIHWIAVGSRTVKKA